MIIKLPEQSPDHSGHGGGRVAVIVQVRSVRGPECQRICEEHNEEDDDEFDQILMGRWEGGNW